ACARATQKMTRPDPARPPITSSHPPAGLACRPTGPSRAECGPASRSTRGRRPRTGDERPRRGGEHPQTDGPPRRTDRLRPQPGVSHPRADGPRAPAMGSRPRRGGHPSKPCGAILRVMKKKLATAILLVACPSALLAAQTADMAQASAKGPASTSVRLTADTPETTVLGNTFIAPAGWSLSVRGPATILEAPEGDSWIALVDVQAP